MIKEYISYLKDNPEHLWFKRKLYGWGWVPVRWQGWLVVVVGIAVVFFGLYVGQTDDAPGAAALGIFLMIIIIFTFGYWKGEKPRWQWGPPRDKN
jgi:drug/metabolite transporter (DMT)-like permease